jgi:hypothetical protein
MADDTGYLYGDSTPSPLTFDFIAFLRDAVNFGVAVLLADSRITDAAQRVAQLTESTEKEIEGAEAFATEVSLALDRIAAASRGSSLAARCAARMRQEAIELVRSEAEAARAAVGTQKTGAQHLESIERASCMSAFENLIFRHTLPETVSATSLHVQGATDYAAQLHGMTAYGLAWEVSLQIPPAHPLAHVLRIDRIVERLEIEAPEEAGWLHKETKLRPQRLDRFYLAAATMEEAETIIKLRAAPDGTGAGFDLSFKPNLQTVRLVRIREGKDEADLPYDAAGENVAKLQSLHGKLIAMASELLKHKKKLLSASLDDTPIRELERPRVLAERLIESIAPTVQQIAKRSHSPGELVLRRLLSDNRREELFMSKAELDAKLEPLPVALRRVFEPFKLWEPAPRRSDHPMLSPEPAAPKAMPPTPAPPGKAPPSPPPSAVAPYAPALSPQPVSLSPQPASLQSASPQSPSPQPASVRPPRPLT